MRWLGTPGAFSHCLAHMSRAKNQAFSLEFDSYARRYADEGLPIHRPAELQPHFPWSIAWRDGDLPQPVADYVDIALKTSETRDWQHFSPVAENPWLPPDVPVQADLTRPGRWSDEQVPARESAMKPHAGTHQGGGSGRHENNP